MVTLDVSPVGTFTGKSQVEDYRYALESMSLLDFVTHTYEEQVKQASGSMEIDDIDGARQHHERPKNLQIPMKINTCFTRLDNEWLLTGS